MRPQLYDSSRQSLDNVSTLPSGNVKKCWKSHRSNLKKKMGVATVPPDESRGTKGLN
ncbi:unnamed protein product [Penicillium roqueforti FM164]|uniref:Genomic scaffold, ProqFM164S01 n=1 Tax=Penicillium roqueforti (strain FM164) TaxID=1365484 RepID=W6QID8_PENRF|nr:unnamed protein product [Penicillium roqueforti FM164]